VLRPAHAFYQEALSRGKKDQSRYWVAAIIIGIKFIRPLF
jgi:hypothetical protein